MIKLFLFILLLTGSQFVLADEKSNPEKPNLISVVYGTTFSAQSNYQSTILGQAKNHTDFDSNSPVYGIEFRRFFGGTHQIGASWETFKYSYSDGTPSDTCNLYLLNLSESYQIERTYFWFGAGFGAMTTVIGQPSVTSGTTSVNLTTDRYTTFADRLRVGADYFLDDNMFLTFGVSYLMTTIKVDGDVKSSGVKVGDYNSSIDRSVFSAVFGIGGHF